MGQMAGVQFLAEARDFFIFHSFKIVSGAHPVSNPMGTWALSPGVKWPRNETDHSPPSSAEVKNDGAIPPIPIHLHGMVLN
jgi:hypothetical protein